MPDWRFSTQIIIWTVLSLTTIQCRSKHRDSHNGGALASLEDSSESFSLVDGLAKDLLRASMEVDVTTKSGTVTNPPNYQPFAEAIERHEVTILEIINSDDERFKTKYQHENMNPSVAELAQKIRDKRNPLVSTKELINTLIEDLKDPNSVNGPELQKKINEVASAPPVVSR